MQNRCYGPVDIALLVPSLPVTSAVSFTETDRLLMVGANFHVLARQARSRGISVGLDHLGWPRPCRTVKKKNKEPNRKQDKKTVQQRTGNEACAASSARQIIAGCRPCRLGFNNRVDKEPTKKGGG
ncbi:hypothetical protein K0M31_009761 [Melipona bicolor]|uniref:Uncharacterized protein n=1 Tax=Melipona bicolor TaxID=60889 RepID=A0AA40FNA6_9HYME|nr:hypothetical protein K0M31_009761 [Melipona bicolor]